MTLILHAERQSKNVYKILIAAEYAGVEVKMFDNFKVGVSNKSPEYLKMNPLRHYPVLETPDGPIFESHAIARYVARGSSLFGSSPIEYGQVEQWIEFSSSTIDTNLRLMVVTRKGTGRVRYNESDEEVLIGEVKTGLDALNKHLGSHTFLVGESVTLADIITTCSLLLGFEMFMPKSFTCQYPHVERYFWKMMKEANFRKISGDVKQLEATVPFPPPNKPDEVQLPVTTPWTLKHQLSC